MNILFVVGQLLPLSDTNTIIMRQLAQELARQFPQMKISFLGFSGVAQGQSRPGENRDVTAAFVPNQRAPYSEKLESLLTQTASMGIKKRLAVFLKSPALLLELLIKRAKNGSMPVQYARAVKRAIQEQSFDVIVGVSAPFHAPYGVVRAGIGRVPFVYYQLDPYFSHYLQPNRKRAVRLEDRVCRRADHIIMTDLIRKDYERSVLKKYLHKSSVLPFPAFLSRDEQEQRAAKGPQAAGNVPARLVFVGSLYGDIRSPLFLLQLACALRRSGKVFHLDIVGPIRSPLGEAVLPYIKELGEFVTFHGSVPAHQAQEWVRSADVLVNIANTVPNQLPSKIFEYFASGKPILNLYKLMDCPTLEYMQKYPLGLSVFERNEMNDALIGQVWSFIDDTKGKLIDFDQVSKLYQAYTIQAVSDEFGAVLKRLISASEKEC